MKKKSKITVTINGGNYTFPHGVSLDHILDNTPHADIPVMGAFVNGFIEDLSYPIITNSQIEWVDLRSSIGVKVYQRSLRLLLIAVHEELFPNRTIRVEHSLELGFYCESWGDKPLGAPDIKKIELGMKNYVSKKLPITKKLIYKEDAIKFYQQRDHNIKADMINDGTERLLKFYEMDNTIECFFGDLATNTKQINIFELIPFDKGFIVRTPSIKRPDRLSDYTPMNKLGNIFNRYDRWATGLQLGQVGNLNQAIRDNRSKEIVAIAEAMQEQELHNIALDIIKKIDNIKMILIAGPSSSGKTTFSYKLGTALRVNGIRPITIAMDDYFLNREATPIDENGGYNFESIEALDIKLFNDHLTKLINGETVETPIFDFKTGARREETRTMTLEKNQVLVIEGIHGLNHTLTASIPIEQKALIYISALTQLNFDEYNPIASSDNRLIRRMARDMATRGTSPAETIMRWESVRHGEDQNIFPYQENADYYFNSALVYELACLKPVVINELKKIPTNHQAYHEARRLISILDYILPIEPDLVPNISLLREFIGGSYYEV